MPAPAALAGSGESLPTPYRRKPARRLPPEVLGPEEVLARCRRETAACAAARPAAADLFDAVAAEMAEFAGGEPQRDDLTMAAIRRRA